MAVKKLVKNNIKIKGEPGKQVLLTITIGNAQIGGSVIRWKGQSEIIGKGEITNLNLGLSADIKDRVLRITTNVLDVNEQTNGIVINHYFFQAFPQLFPYADKVNNDGDIFQLVTEYTFQ